MIVAPFPIGPDGTRAWIEKSVLFKCSTKGLEEREQRVWNTLQDYTKYLMVNQSFFMGDNLLEVSLARF